MNDQAHPDPTRLDAARNVVQTFLERKKKWTTALFVVAGICEVIFFVLMLAFMDFQDRFNWFLLFGFLFVYMPLILITWRNSFMMDRLYYRLIYELKYEDSKKVSDQ